MNIDVVKKEAIRFKCVKCEEEFPQNKELEVHILLKHTVFFFENQKSEYKNSFDKLLIIGYVLYSGLLLVVGL